MRVIEDSGDRRVEAHRRPLGVVGANGYEADDVIGTLATGAPMPVDVVTGDRDLLCRVVARDNTHLQDVINAMLHTGAVQRSTSSISMTRQIPFRIDPLIEAAADL